MADEALPSPGRSQFPSATRAEVGEGFKADIAVFGGNGQHSGSVRGARFSCYGRHAQPPTQHVILGPCRKRADLAGEPAHAERQLVHKRASLATLDATLNLFEPTSNAVLIPPIRPSSKRCPFFRHGESTRLCISALREAERSVSYRYVVEYAIQMKGLDVADQPVRRQVARVIQSSLAGLVSDRWRGR
jgi:hypothetical protein